MKTVLLHAVVMTALALYENAPRCVLGLKERNKRAQDVITGYARAHAAMDIGIGLTAFIPIPGAATAALIGAVLAQAPLVYRPMAKELANIYTTSLNDSTDKMIRETVLQGATYDVAIEIGTEFLQEIASDLIVEAGAGLFASAIPLLGPFLAAGLDATVAATLTWRVGTMISAYFQIGETWVNSRHFTYKLAEKAVRGFSPVWENRADLDDFGKSNPIISHNQLQYVLSLIEVAREFAGDRANIFRFLESKKVPSWLIEKGLQAAFA